MSSRILTATLVVLAAIVPIAVAASPLRSGDRIAVNVFNHPELAVVAGTIDADGASSGTYIGVYLRNGGTVVNGAAVGSAATIEGTSDGVRIDSYSTG